MRRKTLPLPSNLYGSLIKPKIWKGRENSDRVYESATERVQRADKDYCRDMHQGETGHDQAFYLIVSAPPFHYEPYENTAMAKDKEPLEAFTATAAQTAEQMTKETQGAMENYFGWLHR
jgi:hypothetical protein